ncbi:MAG: tRNA (adenosine(37)-N6)-threonylcarbamoyltransferase complex ATPase subunit type 1 TsaE [Sutterellaceae bacterium]|nr:tRNA (adenosine(37)-N6)-threonylcarbamoyltransferase complex ATPase subunit type 1 TsaE [Burkholderiaceae bacterium]MCX7902773.1 tRNA (adenosine(37)-N6)-threonylcarbamoyltransferase complex ATPase subunit type 1 TsaE [Burkholderiaceae bacterium]MDW8430850.1 tRNA (adenosine(37)-N6)-threonylcarbamoyltransferase complex ATPase subunit type 1 TsaE [Sutterellaceae bacterium]
MDTFTVLLADEAATGTLGAAVARALLAEQQAIAQRGFIWTLTGDLGAGKTALVRACLHGLGVKGPVKSPTFSLLEPYVVSSLDFYHFDFFRFRNSAEFSAAGFRELFSPGRICVVEWPERAAPLLPAADLETTLSVADSGRLCTLSAHSELGSACLKRIRATWEPHQAPDGAR